MRDLGDIVFLSFLRYLRKQSFQIQLFYYFCFSQKLVNNKAFSPKTAGVLGCLCHNKSVLDNPEWQYEAIFQATGYPKIGDIPMLNRKVFKADRVSIREHPYVVSIRRKYAHYATGALLMKDLVISVAHPFHRVPINELGVVTGQNYADRGTNIMTVLLVIIHEDFDPYTLTGDIALLRLYEDIQLKTSVKSISLVSPTTKLEGFRAFVTGWGRCDRTGRELCLPRSNIYFPGEKLDPMLRTVTFTILASNSYCDAYKRHETPVGTGMLCVGPARNENPICPCMAVPGAPLVVDSHLAGLQSWGFGCGYKHDLPLVYTDIRYYLPWLLINIPIMRKISSSDLKPFFEATKCYVFMKWLEQARNMEPLNIESTRTEIQSVDIDVLLSEINGTVYEIRDFIDEGIYRGSKKNIHESIKATHNKMKKLEEVNITTEVAVPFISNKTLNENGLYLNNSLLNDNISFSINEENIYSSLTNLNII